MKKMNKSSKSKSNLVDILSPEHSQIAKIDQLDYQILWHLDYEARKPSAEIARCLGLSKQALRYRTERLRHLGIISNSYAVIDIHRLGLLTFRVYYRFKGLDSKLENQILKQFVDCQNTLWVVSTEGSWDMELVFVARDTVHFNSIFKEHHFKISKHIRRYNISSAPISYQLRRDYLIANTRKVVHFTYYGFEPLRVQRDKIDYSILTELSTNAQQSNSEIAMKLKIPNSAVAKRINNLERDNIIRSYRQPVSLGAINRIYVKALLVLGNLDARIEKEIFAYCTKEAFVAYITEVVGEWQLEVECEVYTVNQLTDFVKRLTSRFPDNVLDYDILRITKEHKLNYLPTGLGTTEYVKSSN
jgi:DNA-binding Lrp family transcriptional regulator